MGLLFSGFQHKTKSPMDMSPMNVALPGIGLFLTEKKQIRCVVQLVHLSKDVLLQIR